MNYIPVVDLFAGPGGLGEGFSSLLDKQGGPIYDVILSIEKQRDAHQTLELRSFYRKFRSSVVPNEYYQYLRGTIGRDELFSLYPEQALKAREEALCLELGKDEEVNTVIDAKLDNLLEHCKDGKWVLIGGPPCQAYSVVGRARNRGIKDYSLDKDPKSYLYKEYLRILAEHEPAVFVMENVKGMLSSKINGELIFDKIISDLKCPSQSILEGEYNTEEVEDEYDIYSLVSPEINVNSGDYKPRDFIVESEKYGIPQARHRVIIFGVRKDLAHVRPGKLSEEKQVTTEEVLSGLPIIRSGLSREEDTLDNWRERVLDALDRRWFTRGIAKRHNDRVMNHVFSAIAELEPLELTRGGRFVPHPMSVKGDLDWWFIDDRVGGACNHETKAHMVTDIHRYLFAAAFTECYGRSPKIMEFPADLLPKHKNAKSGHFDDRFRVQVAGKPSTTVTSHISKDGHYFIHYDPIQCRSLTVREAARLQTFPDNYFFEGSRTQQYIQVGNAVPPLLARKIAKITYNLICCVS